MCMACTHIPVSQSYFHIIGLLKQSYVYEALAQVNPFSDNRFVHGHHIGACNLKRKLQQFISLILFSVKHANFPFIVCL